MESIDQLFGNRVGVANISKVKGYHQRDEHALEEVQLLHPRLWFMHLDYHADKVMNLAGHGKDKPR